MINAKDINQWVHEVISALPVGAQNYPENLREHLRAALAGCFNKLDLVTREEFDAQLGVLQKTRAKLEKLEGRLKELETQIPSP